MICFYVEGSKELGLGHLSRITPIYYDFLNHGHLVHVFHFGDELGQAFLDLHQIKYISADNDCQSIKNDEYKDALWLVDATDFHTKNFDDFLRKIDRKVLLSPKFKSDKVNCFSHCIIRSDPFELPIPNKKVSPKYFPNNRSDFFISKGTLTLGIALSGGYSDDHLSDLISSLINDSDLNNQIKKIYVFIGSNDTISFIRQTKESYFPEIIIVSSLNSLWSYANDIDYFIVGNGIIIDECIQYGKPFSVYITNNKNKEIKSAYKERILSSSNIEELKIYLHNYLFDSKHEQKKSVYNEILDIFTKVHGKNLQ